MTPEWLEPDWPAPANVRAAVTTRRGGVGLAPFDGLNLAAHVGDDPAAVGENRRLLRIALGLAQEPAWLSQVHGVNVIEAGASGEADGAWTNRAGPVCAVLTADCLPVLLCDAAGERVAAAHAGWRGLAAGVLEQTIAAMGADPEGLLAWLGPAIGPEAFEVGEEVRECFLRDDAGAGECFAPSPRGRWLADLYGLARRRLRRIGVHRVYGGGFCTFADSKRFFSYRRDGRTGRMASLVWRAS